MTRKKRPKEGDSVLLRRTIEPEDVDAFASLSLDYNPIHFDEAFAAKTVFGRKIAHGMIGAALISGALTELMGGGNIWLSANIDFRKPIFDDDKLSAKLTIEQMDRRGVAEISVTVSNDRKEVVIGGSVRSMTLIR